MGAMVMLIAVSTSILVLQRGYQSLDDARNTTLATQVLQSLMEDLRLNNWTQITTLQSTNNGVAGNITIDSSFTGYSTTAANMLSDFTCTRTITVTTRACSQRRTGNRRSTWHTASRRRWTTPCGRRTSSRRRRWSRRAW